MKNNFTHGEWSIEDSTNQMLRRCYDIKTGVETICSTRVSMLPTSEQEANAKLIAAAPFMFGALQEAVEHAHVYDTNKALIELFEAAIKKATE